MGLISIELIDDYRSEGNNGNNAYIDEDVYYDAYGFPYFPAYLMRNSLLKIAKNTLSKDEIEGIFGNEENAGSLVLEHALIGSRASMLYAIVSSGDKILQNQKLVLSQFTQTKRYYSNGRECTYRTLNNGLIFEQCFTLDEKYEQTFESLVSQCTSFSSGSGRVRCEVDWDIDKSFVYGNPEKSAVDFSLECEGGCGREVCDDCDCCDVMRGDAEHASVQHTSVAPGNTKARMHYSLKLLSETCVLEPLDAMNETKTFIPGELVCRALGLDEAGARGVKTSFAFCEIDGERSYSAPASFLNLKTDKKQIRDKLSSGRKPNDFDQLKKISESYISDPNKTKVRTMSVEVEYGKIEKCDPESDFVLYQAIRAGQTFKGFFEGDVCELKKIAKRAEVDPFIKIGEHTENGFGLCEIKLDGLTWSKIDDACVSDCATADINTNVDAGTISNTAERDRASVASCANELRVDVASALVLRKSNGLFTDSQDEFLRALCKLLEVDDLEMVLGWRNTDQAQGYSKQWLEKKPIMHLIKAGSTFLVRRKCKEPIYFSDNTAFIGEFTEYGFGEIKIHAMEHLYYRTQDSVSFDYMKAKVDKPLDKKPGRALVNMLHEFCAQRLAHSLGQNDAARFYNSMYKTAKHDVQNALDIQSGDSVVLDEYIAGIQEMCNVLAADAKNS